MQVSSWAPIRPLALVYLCCCVAQYYVWTAWGTSILQTSSYAVLIPQASSCVVRLFRNVGASLAFLAFCDANTTLGAELLQLGVNTELLHCYIWNAYGCTTIPDSTILQYFTHSKLFLSCFCTSLFRRIILLCLTPMLITWRRNIKGF